MKRLLASGHRDIYEMGRVFRAGETGRFHNPEFTLLEWYRLAWNYLDLAGEAIELIRVCGRGQFDGWPVNQLTYREMFRQETGLDPLACDEADLESCALERGLQAGPMDHQEWLDLVLSQRLPAYGAGIRRWRSVSRSTWGKWNWPMDTRN